MNPVAVIQFNQVSKKFCKNIRKIMLYGLGDIIRNIITHSSQQINLRSDEFWALRGINFHVKEGETLGIIGMNGSGKSSLLKLIEGIFLPDIGTIQVKGKTGALIEVGAGFHPSLTGRENIFLNGTILGMSKQQIDRQFDKIVAFAEIEEFLETPVKNYSSGMYVRLGFSIAIHSEPDILLTDEILAVGDSSFQKKCFQRMKQLKKDKNTTIILVSHDMRKIRLMCDRCIWLDKGRIKEIGSTGKVTQAFEEFNQ